MAAAEYEVKRSLLLQFRATPNHCALAHIFRLVNLEGRYPVLAGLSIGQRHQIPLVPRHSACYVIGHTMDRNGIGPTDHYPNDCDYRDCDGQMARTTRGVRIAAVHFMRGRL